MNKLQKLQTAASGIVLSAVLVVSTVGSAYAAPDSHGKPGSVPPETNVTSGSESKPPVEPGSVDAAQTESLGGSSDVKTNAKGEMLQSFSTLSGSVANVDFQTPLNYCYKNLTYTPVKNTTSSTKYLKVRLYNQSSYREIYTSVAANSTAYPAFYGVEGTYYAYLYVWNGSTYQYDEYLSNSNVCKVDVTRTYNASGWVQLKIQNTGTAYASQQSTELAPFPASGTYTGTHYDYPSAGGAAIYRWFWVGTSPYGIVSDTLGSSNYPYYFSGDL